MSEIINNTDSLLRPSFLRILADSSIRTVMLCGCGGGFDFVHSMLLYPELRRMGKEVIIGSYSFGAPEQITGQTTVFFEQDGVLVKRVTAASIPATGYGPEVHMCSYLDLSYPATAPHSVYAYYARAFTVPLLAKLLRQLVDQHSVDALVLFDGGSDSLMAGDEEGLGDPIEDAVSITAAAAIDGLQAKMVISVGFGADRFNQVSDASSLRAVAELTDAGGFLGSIAIERDTTSFRFYRDCLEHIYLGHGPRGFRSVLSGVIVAAVQGGYGRDQVPLELRARVRTGQVFLWPLMAILWAFDVGAVAERSLIASWIGECETVQDCYLALYRGRAELGTQLRRVENLPRHEEMRRPIR